MSRYVREYLFCLVLITATDLMIHGGIERGAVYFILLPALGIVLGFRSVLEERRRRQ